MPIGTSDGQSYNSDWDYEIQKSDSSFASNFRKSPNVEDDRTFADKWGGAFGPANGEGGPPDGVDPKIWYSPQLSHMNPFTREAYINSAGTFTRPQDIKYFGTQSADDLAAPYYGDDPFLKKNGKLPPGNEMAEYGTLYGRKIEQYPFPGNGVPSQAADTRLSYEDWVKQNHLTETEDYDLKAAYEAGFKPDRRGHLPDDYKKPNHITFSDESVYNGKDGNQGGHWEQDSNGKWSFTPGPTNLKNHTVEDLKEYFKKYEPDAKLILPGQ